MKASTRVFKMTYLKRVLSFWFQPTQPEKPEPTNAASPPLEKEEEYVFTDTDPVPVSAESIWLAQAKKRLTQEFGEGDFEHL